MLVGLKGLSRILRDFAPISEQSLRLVKKVSEQTMDVDFNKSNKIHSTYRSHIVANKILHHGRMYCNSAGGVPKRVVGGAMLKSRSYSPKENALQS